MRTKAIIPVDIAGFPCDYDEIMDLVKSSEIRPLFKAESENQEKLGRILVLNDAAHSLGAWYKKGMRTGSETDIAIFSLHAVKNVTTAEGGAICINLPAPFDNAKLYGELRQMALNCQTKDAFSKSKAGGWRYDITGLGMKINMADVNAAIGLAQIRIYEDLLKERKGVFDTYGEVAVNVHFIPMPMLTLFKNLGYKIEDYPQAYNNYKCEISLPIYPQLTDEQVKFVIDTVVSAYNKVK